jgi:hypothetical protein
MPPDRREERREDLLTLQAEFRSEAELIQQCLAEWRARAQERGCSPEEAQREAFIVLVRGFTWAAALPPLDPSRRYRLRDIRERIRRKLLVSGIPDEGALLIICRVLLEFVSDRSGLSLRLVSTEPAYWSGNAEGVFDRLYHQFEEDLDLLERELGRLAKATRHLSGPAFQRLLTRRLNREFLDQRRR